MSYITLLQLEITHHQLLSIEQFTECLNKINDLTLDKARLIAMYHGMEVNMLHYTFDHKDQLMHKISSYYPDFIFKLYGDGKTHKEDWHETWKNGKIIALNEKTYMPFIIEHIEKNHPEIYEQCIKTFYYKRKNKYDADFIIYNQLELNKHVHIDQTIGYM